MQAALEIEHLNAVPAAGNQTGGEFFGFTKRSFGIRAHIDDVAHYGYSLRSIMTANYIHYMFLVAGDRPSPHRGSLPFVELVQRP